ncbi:MAG: nucleotidyltransferase domain-containing protein [Candidatus Aramenus sp.]|nr:nucleotidyltransferase domain-containing protein [Candidatus Aramenus sp.]
MARATKDLCPECKVYVFGGVAEGRVTVLSDIDVLVVSERKLSDREVKELRMNIMLRAMDIYNLPFDAPVELHVVDKERAEKYFKVARKLVEINVY